MTGSSAKCCRFRENDAKTMDKERFVVQNAANTVEIAASRFEMLQIARKMDRTMNLKKSLNVKTKLNNSRPFIIIIDQLLPIIIMSNDMYPFLITLIITSDRL